MGGEVLPVGGIREKVVAARAEGINTVILPAANEVDVEEITADEDIAEILAPPESFNDLAMALEADGIVPADSGIVRIPENQVQITDTSVAKQVVRLLDNLEDCDDVQGVVSNADFDDAVLEALAADE